ncbi:hypothetical protein ATY43_16630 [Xanthomonas oryzae pv. oryzae]|nr:hypothetical protein AZ54_17020 [Xanthomonas oryzae pv. oryzae PXO86]ALZ72760.1 hypothetical protein APZ20_15950 [Xanthomonas oryzae pv. oryzae]AOS07394.1 hypothetical protein ATY43_16630 [Xanthomonas oryzae pv. oryzae]AOS11567.1 hypothetical protein ATY44_16090 [Xanthomonas oryzae pv. oryzae]OLH90648.1 hypothetical protein DXO216_07590 [Xanthomonas oryzae pv. oryzae]
MLRGMSGSPARVLVVEDEAAIADTVLYALRSEDYAPDTADSRAVSRVKCNTSRDLLLAQRMDGQPSRPLIVQKLREPVF